MPAMGTVMASAGLGLRLSVPWPEMLSVLEMNWALSGTVWVPWPLKVIDEFGVRKTPSVRLEPCPLTVEGWLDSLHSARSSRGFVASCAVVGCVASWLGAVQSAVAPPPVISMSAGPPLSEGQGKLAVQAAMAG